MLDMDGVLVDNEGGLAALEGMSLVEFEQERTDAEFDLLMDATERHIDEKPFETFKPMPEFKEFLRLISLWQRTGEVKVEILSSVSRSPSLMDKLTEQKKVWLSNHGLGHLEAEFPHGSSEKYRYAEPGHWCDADY